MGSCMSCQTEVAAEESSHKEKAPVTPPQVNAYKLKKTRAGGSGMLWQPDPTGRKELLAETNWPRDGAYVSGEEVDLDDGTKWLKAHRVRQASWGSWTDAPDGAFLPFEYEHHYYLEQVPVFRSKKNVEADETTSVGTHETHPMRVGSEDSR